MNAIAEQERLSAATQPVGELIPSHRRVDLWTLCISVLLVVLLVVTVAMIGNGLSRAAVATPAPVTLPIAAPVAPAVAVPAVVPERWAWESDTHSGTVPGYTTAPRSSGADLGEVNPESGQAMSGVIFR